MPSHYADEWTERTYYVRKSTIQLNYQRSAVNEHKNKYHEKDKLFSSDVYATPWKIRLLPVQCNQFCCRHLVANENVRGSSNLNTVNCSLTFESRLEPLKSFLRKSQRRGKISDPISVLEQDMNSLLLGHDPCLI